MSTLGLLMVLALTASGAVVHDGPISPTDEHDADSSRKLTKMLMTSSLPIDPRNHGDLDDLDDKDSNLIDILGRFDKCKLKPNPKPRDLIRFRLCIKRILEREGGTGDGGRWGRSVDDKFRRLHAGAAADNAATLVIGSPALSKHHRVARSIEALCAGDLSAYDHDVREYISWRCKNGYGQLMRRWGRAAAWPPYDGDDKSHSLGTSGSSNGDVAAAASAGSHSKYLVARSNAAANHSPVEARFDSSENDVLRDPPFISKEVIFGDLRKKSGFDEFARKFKLFYSPYRAKRDDDDMSAIIEAYREWRSQNGYGQTGGRWG